jgi:hypothetical protein
MFLLQANETYTLFESGKHYPRREFYSLIEDIPSGDESDINDESENEYGN